MRRSDARLDQLLARGDLGGETYDEILEKVLGRTAAPRAASGRRWRRLLLLPAAAALGLASWLVFARPSGEPFTPKGDPVSDALAIGCRFPGGPCRAGEKLVFAVNAAKAHGYLGAYAERAGDPSRARIWYFPTAAGVSPLVAPGDRTRVVPEGIEIGPEHTPGRYRVTVWLSSRPLDRSEVDRTDIIRARTTLVLEVRP